MSVGDVKTTFARVTQDGKIDSKDVDTILESAGGISSDEENEIRAEADKFAGMTDPDAKEKLREKLGEVAPLRQQATEINKQVKASQHKLSDDLKARLAAGAATKTFGGTAIP